MGIFSFFKNGGALGGMAQAVAKSYNKLNRESESELEALLLTISLRYLVSPMPDRHNISRSVFNIIVERIENGINVGLFDVCYAIAQTEMDIIGIEDYTKNIIKNNLDNAGIPSYIQTGRRYSEQELREVKHKFSTATWEEK